MMKPVTPGTPQVASQAIANGFVPPGRELRLVSTLSELKAAEAEDAGHDELTDIIYIYSF